MICKITFHSGCCFVWVVGSACTCWHPEARGKHQIPQSWAISGGCLNYVRIWTSMIMTILQQVLLNAEPSLKALLFKCHWPCPSTNVFNFDEASLTVRLFCCLCLWHLRNHCQILWFCSFSSKHFFHVGLDPFWVMFCVCYKVGVYLCESPLFLTSFIEKTDPLTLKCLGWKSFDHIYSHLFQSPLIYFNAPHSSPYASASYHFVLCFEIKKYYSSDFILF